MEKLPTQRGNPSPLGAVFEQEGINFALFSAHAKKVKLLLYLEDKEIPYASYDLDPLHHKTGQVWHIFLKTPAKKVFYAYEVDGKGPLHDPYAKALKVPKTWMDIKTKYHPIGILEKEEPFDWENIEPPGHKNSELILYEMHVRGFTIDTSAKVKHPGTYLGIIEKIPYLLDLGINAVELLPIFEFNETEYHKHHPKTHERLCNYWGYSTVNFFCPMRRFAATDNPLREFKTLVRELHRRGIEVILDVVYNHTAEGNEQGPYYSFKGIDKASYYYLTPKGKFADYTGCGNTFKSNYTPASDLILDSLRYFVIECQVDGFRFDLASILTRGSEGNILANPPLIQRITEDPVISQKKLIAEPWDAAGAYQVGHFPGHIFAEWNGYYRDSVRRFIKGSDDSISHFSNALCGSQNLYAHKNHPHVSINFITAHDGFTLADLVSYQNKHNEANGEHNADGSNNNENWNCGFEGITEDSTILALRERQMKNFLLALFFSNGTPMLLMGDEYQHSRLGNNNTWCQDNELNWFLWQQSKEKKPFFEWVKKLIALRKTIPLFQEDKFFDKHDIEWHGLEPKHPDWSYYSHFIACTFKSKDHHHGYYVAFNSYYQDLNVHLPRCTAHHKWHLVTDTYENKNYWDSPLLLNSSHYLLQPYSALILKAL